MSDSVPNSQSITVRPVNPQNEEASRAAYQERWPVLDWNHPELYFRIGVLICAAIFFVEACGQPYNESAMVLGAAAILSGLFSLTMAFQWRILGDWRVQGNQLLLGLFTLTLVVPFTAIMTPSLNEFPLPEATNIFIQNAFSDLMNIPGVSQLLGFARGIMIFVFFLISMIVLILNIDSTRRAGLTIMGVLYSVILLVLYPTVETIIGLLFLIFFIRLQWEKPLMVPTKLLPHLKTIQLEYLRELIREGSLSTGETKVYLNQNPNYFAELLDFQLVEVDSIARDILPGPRLTKDPSTETMEKFAAYTKRMLWIMAGLIYFIMPDLIPFYIDDAIIMMIASGAGFNWIKALFGQTKRRSRMR